MTEAKKPLSKPKDLSSEELAQARGGLAAEKKPVAKRLKEVDGTTRPFVVDGPYT